MVGGDPVVRAPRGAVKRAWEIVFAKSAKRKRRSAAAAAVAVDADAPDAQR